MGVFSYLGYRLGEGRPNAQYWTLGGMFLGLLYCGYEVWKLIGRLDNGNKDDK